nr:EOG090X0F1W [Polyphemus pediculus]
MVLNNTLASSEDVVLVTGFGPFGDIKVNASIEAVKLLSSLDIEQELHIKLVTQEVPVQYDYVKSNIHHLWKTHKPKLVLHVGVSGIAHELNLEQQAFNSGYCSPDISGCIPSDNVCIPEAQNVLKSKIDMNTVCQSINNSSCGVMSCVSDDPGRYLCDYIYYNSLHFDNARAAFIHVPVLNSPYTALQLAQGLKEAIKAMLEQIRENEAKSN